MKIRDALVALHGQAIVELDYSQLEIYCLAALTNDETLVQELIDGKDTHQLNLERWIKADSGRVGDKTRKKAKMLSFQLSYGATAFGMARELGIPKAQCQAFIDGFYLDYDQVRAWHDSIQYTAEVDGYPCDLRVQGFPIKEYKMVMPYGKRYTFRQEVREKKDKRGRIRTEVNFKPTYLKNYAVQGLASDIIRFSLAVLWRTRAGSKYRLINTIHDSILITCPESEVEDSARYVSKVMRESPLIVLRELGFYWPTGLKLQVDVEYGNQWSNMSGLES